MATIMSPSASSTASSSSKSPANSSSTSTKSPRKFAERMRLLLVGSLAVPPFNLLEPKSSVDVKRPWSSEVDHGSSAGQKNVVGRHAKSSSLTGRGFRYWGPRDVEGPPRIQRNLPQYQSERAGSGGSTARGKSGDSSSNSANDTINHWRSNTGERESPRKDRSQSFSAGRRFSYQETDPKDSHVHHHVIRRDEPKKLAPHDAIIVNPDLKQQAEESIYENVRPPVSTMEQPMHAEEPPPPPQPPYTLQGLEEPRPGVRLERDRERRSLRKLTKDSGYETSQYAESDYANLDWDSEHAGSDAGALSDRSPTNKSTRSPSDWGASDQEFSPRNSAVYMDSYRTDVWRAGQLYWSAHGSSSSSSNSNSTRPSHRSSSSHPSRHHHQDSWDQHHWVRSNRGYNSSDDKPQSPIAPLPSSGHQHRKTASYSHGYPAVRPVDSSRTERNLGRYSSTDSLSSYSSVFSYPPPSVSSAKSTPALLQDADLEDGQPIPPQPPHAINSSRSTPNLEELDADGMVTRPFKKGPSVYNDLASKSGFNFSPMVQGRPYWEDHESREEYESQLRTAAVSAYQGQHSRQVSSQSSGSDRTSSSYSASQHSRQVSSQSSFSEEDYRIQSIKEEFHQRTSQDYYSHLPAPPLYEKEVAATLPPYLHRYCSSDNLLTSYTGDRDADLKKAQHYSWAKSQPDLKGAPNDSSSPSKSPTSPPPPPLRDSSSLKYGRFTGGHEKYPSWPVSAGSPTELTDISTDGHIDGTKTDKNAYVRNKKFVPCFAQNLKPVIENSERARHDPPFSKRSDKPYNLPHASYVGYNEESQYRKGVQDSQYPRSNYFHERSHCLGKDFGAPSPPQRDASLKKFGSVPLDQPCVPLDDDDPPPPYSPTGSSSGGSGQFFCNDNRSQDQGYWSPDCKDQQIPSDRDVEEAKENPAKDDDSGSDGTPLMDRLRRESQQGLWASKEDGPATSGSTGRESVTSSNSSQETLKWHGSNSDLSVNSDRAKGNGGVETIVHSARVQPPQRHNSESVLYYGNGAPNNRRTSDGSRERKRESPTQQRQSPQKESSSQCWADQVHKNNLVNAGVGVQRLAASYAYTSLVSPVGADERRPEALAREEFRALPTPEYAKPLSVQQRIQDLERQAHTGHGGSAPVRSRTRPAGKKEREAEPARPKAASPTFPRRKMDSEGGANEKTEMAEPKALYLDPEKKHRVSDPELKAIQKQAVLSFFERHTSSSSGAGRRQPHTLPRDSLHEFKNYASSTEGLNRLERVPEATNRELANQSEAACQDGTREMSSSRHQRLSSSSQRGHPRPDVSTSNSPVKSNPSIVRPVPLRQTDNAPRVAIYYNTYTQTDGEDGYDDTAAPTPVFSATTSPSRTCTRERRIQPIPVEAQSSRPRKDVAVQTEWPWRQSPEHVAQQSTSTTTKALDPSEKTSPDGSISTQLLSRLTKSHVSKPDPPPPQRPPKRPHLQAASSPPPLLPRASSTSPAHQVPIRSLPASPPPPPIVDCPARVSHQQRSPSPDLPLPPPPPVPTSEGEEEEEEDVPLPPPPMLNEVGQLLSDAPPPTPSPLPRTAGSPPLSYPKDSYMSYRNERHPPRQGFEGNYRRTASPLTCSSGEETDEIVKTDQIENMEPVTTSLTPTAWERWHNIGRPGSTVVFTSTDIKSSGALLTTGSKNTLRKNSQPQLSDHRLAKDASSSDNTHVVEGNRLLAAPHSTMPYSRRVSLESSWHQKRQGASADLHRNVSNPSPVSALQHCNGEVSSPSTRSCSLESVHTPPPLHAAAKVLNGHVSPASSSSSSSPQPSVPSRKNSSAEGQSRTDRRRSSLRSETDETKSCSTQTAVRSQRSQQQVEVMTQTTPSIAKCARPKRKEEVECEQLSHDLASQLSAEERLLQVLLVPKQLKTAADYMEGIFAMDQNKSTPRRVSATSTSPPAALDKIKRSPEAAPLPADSAYFTTSESKAKFLTRYREDMNLPVGIDMKDPVELGKKKEELVKSITRKLEILRSEQLIIQEEILANQDLGRSVTSRVEKLAKSNELDKYTLHVEEIDKITSLLLGLSGRLARAENALMGFPNNNHPEEQRILEAKRDKLLEQHEEAKKLKENIDRRSHQVSNFLHKYLSSDEYADYDHFIKMKSKLLIDSREIDEKIKLGDEQMLALTESLTKKT